MCNTLKKLGEAELEIMQVIWDNTAPVTSNYILRELQDRRKWQLSTLMTSLSRLANKGYIICDRSTGTNLYTAIVSESDYKTNAGKHFLEQLYNNSIQNMVASLYSSKILNATDLAELRSYLDTLENMEHEEAGQC
ncbi:MAG: BlaI/MecI/CopY family transcriptional regulator [Lachnospiraceae bacterium]|nr:BlaI/MecI/CopY family transcriptional regulator [Lachnospiraceae bacterium]